MRTKSEDGVNTETTAAAFKTLYQTVRTLRAPGGCPWDIEQTPATLRGNLIEESYECIEAIDEGDTPHIKEELGDIFLLAVMLSYMFEQDKAFSVEDVLCGITEKLIRRHPHVFGNIKVKDSDEVLQNWSKIKVEQEGRKPKDSILDEVSRALPALERSFKLQKKAAKTGFELYNLTNIWQQIDKEANKIKEALASGGKNKIEEDTGDFIFSLVNLCRCLNIDPSIALHRANIKFEEQYKLYEKTARVNKASPSL
jgi:tetrapyrrole methylase family protein/MazG family protein